MPRYGLYCHLGLVAIARDLQLWNTSANTSITFQTSRLMSPPLNLPCPFRGRLLVDWLSLKMIICFCATSMGVILHVLLFKFSTSLLISISLAAWTVHRVVSPIAVCHFDYCFVVRWAVTTATPRLESFADVSLKGLLLHFPLSL